MSSTAELVAEAQRQISAVHKNKKAPDKVGGYAYQSIDDIVAMVGPILHELGLTLRHRTRSSEIRFLDRGVMAKVVIRYELVGPDGDPFLLGVVHGAANDFGDKALNKAQTAAKKRCFLDCFNIPTHGLETDAESDPDEHLPARVRRDQQSRPGPGTGSPLSPSTAPVSSHGPWDTIADVTRAGFKRAQVEKRGKQWFLISEPGDASETVAVRDFDQIETETRQLADTGEEPF